jgi:transposase
MKFVKPLAQDDINQLKALIKTSTSFRIRQRAHAILLSAKRYKLDTLADIFDVDRDTMSQWITNWECSGIVGLSDHAKPGRPPKMSGQEADQALKIILESPQQVKAAIPKISEQLGKEVSRDWIKRLLKKSNASGKESANPSVHNVKRTMVNKSSRQRIKT